MTSDNAAYARPKRHIAGTQNTEECNALCRPDEGIHALVGYTNYEDEAKCRRRYEEKRPLYQLLQMTRTFEAPPYVNPKRNLPFAWLAITRYNEV